MIDPYFQKRLWNWSRAIRSYPNTGSNVISPTAQAMEALVLKNGAPNDDIGLAPVAEKERSIPIDLIDADVLSRAYASRHLCEKAKLLLCLKYGQCFSDATCARKLCLGERLFRDIHEAVCEKFRLIVETYYDPR